MKLLLEYLRQKRFDVFIYIIFCSIFAFTFFLYGIPLKAIVYPAVLCGLVAAIFFFHGYVKLKEKHELLQALQEKTSSLIDALPSGDTIEENDMLQVINVLRGIVNENAFTSRQNTDSMVEYYTLWAHQIKTPIASMRLTLQSEDSAVSRKLMAELMRIEQYVEMVLTYLRLDSDETDFLFEKVSLDEIIRSSVRRFSSEFIMRKLRLEFTPTDFELVSDRKWLGFVLEQLISNALKYTPSGSIRIYLAQPATLCIEDTGIGISQNDLPRIFAKGYTGSNGRADMHSSGIGLSLCKRICHDMSIGISAVSAVGVGTKVMLDMSQHIVKE